MYALYISFLSANTTHFFTSTHTSSTPIPFPLLRVWLPAQSCAHSSAVSHPSFRIKCTRIWTLAGHSRCSLSSLSRSHPCRWCSISSGRGGGAGSVTVDEPKVVTLSVRG